MKVLPIKDFNYSKVKLDKKDKLILYYLLKNARLPISKIANLVKTKRENVNYRINRLKESQVITGFRTAINTRDLGYLSFHLFLELPEMSEDNMDKITKQLKNNKHVNVIITYSGRWNLELGIFAKDVNQFREILIEIFSKLTVKDYKVLILGQTIKTSILPKSFFSELEVNNHSLEHTKNDTSFHKDFLEANKSNTQLDEKDKKVLTILGKDASKKIIDLAKQTALSKETVISRIKKLIHNKIIIDFRPVINYYSLGFSVQTILLRLSSSGYKDVQEIENFIKSKDEILWATYTAGEADILIYALTKSQEDIHTLMNSFRNNFPNEIASFENLFAYEEHKYLFYPEEL
jgi:DNA-binding Lrp family transcriptional regulator